MPSSILQVTGQWSFNGELEGWKTVVPLTKLLVLLKPKPEFKGWDTEII